MFCLFSLSGYLPIGALDGAIKVVPSFNVWKAVESSGKNGCYSALILSSKMRPESNTKQYEKIFQSKKGILKLLNLDNA